MNIYTLFYIGRVLKMFETITIIKPNLETFYAK